MSESHTFTIWLGVLAIVSYGCRMSGFWLMRYLPRTSRLEAAFRHAPVAVMLGIIVPALTRGQTPELVGAVVVVVLMVAQRSDLVAALAGVSAVALARLVAIG